MEIVETFAEARSLNQGVVGFAPTLGFVHEGHLSLIERARAETDHVLVSLFVNPLQFGEGEDYAAYPRQLARDARLVESAGADVLFAPAVAEMYPLEPATTVAVAPLAAHLEGVARPTHFAGVATVVAKYFAGLRPDKAFFGRKDAQQLAIITRMAADLSMPVEVVGCPTVREHDGLALSSRNVYLQAYERGQARSLSVGLMAAADRVEAGERSGPALEHIVREAVPAFEFEYVALMARATVTPLAVLDRPAFLAVAGTVGHTRLIDNIHLDIENGEVSVDRGVRLAGPSLLYEQ